MLWALLLTAIAAADNNLLQNGGFEQLASDAPVQWKLFIMPPAAPAAPAEAPGAPADAATGGVDTVAREGSRSVFLHNPVPYAQDPCNNWSQVVWGSLSGKKVRLSGSIKTDDADTAAIWTQCWQRTPSRLLHLASTGDQTPVSGTADWTNVELTTTVPAGTDFIVVRCVLRGKGKAWFDGISLSEVAQPPAPPKPEPPPTPAPAHPAKQDIKDLEAVLQSLREASKANEDLLAQVANLHQEIQALRDQLQALQQATASAAAGPEADAPPPPAPAKKVPPLVPHGMKPEEYQ